MTKTPIVKSVTEGEAEELPPHVSPGDLFHKIAHILAHLLTGVTIPPAARDEVSQALADIREAVALIKKAEDDFLAANAPEQAPADQTTN